MLFAFQRIIVYLDMSYSGVPLSYPTQNSDSFDVDLWAMISAQMIAGTFRKEQFTTVRQEGHPKPQQPAVP
jgi:hypothetical protein